MAGQGNRLVVIDIAKGIGIVLVVIFHVYRGQAGTPFALYDPVLPVADYATYLFHMPLFFFLSGLFVDRGLRKGAKAYFSDKLVHIYWPYLLWSTLTLSIMALAGGATKKQVPWDLLWSIPYLPKLHFWFLLTLLLYLTIVFLVRNSIALAVIALSAAIAFEFAPDVYNLGNYLSFFVFFIGGLLMARWVKSYPRPTNFVCLAVLLVSIYVGYKFGIDNRSVTMAPAGFAGTLLTIQLARKFELSKWLSDTFVLLGQQSLAIYMMHVLAASGLRIVLVRLAPWLNGYLVLVLSIAAGIAFPLAVATIARKLRILTITGLGKDRPRAVPAPAD